MAVPACLLAASLRRLMVPLVFSFAQRDNSLQPDFSPQLHPFRTFIVPAAISSPPSTLAPPDCPPHPSRQGKLCLVLDLDHTLLNSATFSEVGRA